MTVRALQKTVSMGEGGRIDVRSWCGDVHGADWSRVQGWLCSLVPKAPGEEALPPPREPRSILVRSSTDWVQPPYRGGSSDCHRMWVIYTSRLRDL